MNNNDRNGSVARCGRATAILAPNIPPGTTLAAGAEITIGPDLWRVPRPLKLLRLHGQPSVPENLVVWDVKIAGETVIYGPIPFTLFCISTNINPLLDARWVGTDRWNPWLGQEVDQNTQISMRIQNFDPGAQALLFWFSTGALTGNPDAPPWGA